MVVAAVPSPKFQMQVHISLIVLPVFRSVLVSANDADRPLIVEVKSAIGA